MASTVAKRSIALRRDVAAEAERAAAEDGVSLSAWISEAALQRLHLRAMAAAVADFEAEHGRITDDELEHARARHRRLR